MVFRTWNLKPETLPGQAFDLKIHHGSELETTVDLSPLYPSSQGLISIVNCPLVLLALFPPASRYQTVAETPTNHF